MNVYIVILCWEQVAEIQHVFLDSKKAEEYINSKPEKDRKDYLIEEHRVVDSL